MDLGRGKDVTVLMAIELNFLLLVTTEEKVGPWLMIEFRNNGFRVFCVLLLGECVSWREFSVFFVFSFTFVFIVMASLKIPLLVWYNHL